MEILQHGITSGVKSLATMVAVLEWDLIFMFVGLMIVDLIVGGYKAIKTGTFKTKVMKMGLYGKVVEFSILFTLFLLREAFAQVGVFVVATSAITVAFVVKEAFSILENWLQAGNKLPKSVQKWLEVAKEQLESKSINDKPPDQDH